MARPPAGSGHDDNGILLEFRQMGNSVKVTAVDPVTMVEASIVGPVNHPQEVLSRLAIQKLRYVLAKRNDDSKR